MAVENAGRQKVERKLAIVVDDRMSCIAASLKTDDDVGLIRQHVRDFSFSLIAPIGAYYCSYHLFVSSFTSLRFAAGFDFDSFCAVAGLDLASFCAVAGFKLASFYPAVDLDSAPLHLGHGLRPMESGKRQSAFMQA